MRGLVALTLVAGCSSGNHAAPDAVDSPPPPDAPIDSPPQTPTPIKHVVVIVKENHTFDNYFGSFPAPTASPRSRRRTG